MTVPEGARAGDRLQVPTDTADAPPPPPVGAPTNGARCDAGNH